MTKQLHLTPVILGAGAGTRLWPLSRKRFPKQFAPVDGAADTPRTRFGVMPRCRQRQQ